METKNIEEARKKVQAEKPKDNFMIIPLGYATKYLVPYKDGVAIMAAMANAEKYVHGYSEKTRIIPVEKDDLSFTPLSRKEYELIKMANLLQVSVDDLRDIEPPF